MRLGLTPVAIAAALLAPGSARADDALRIVRPAAGEALHGTVLVSGVPAPAVPAPAVPKVPPTPTLP